MSHKNADTYERVFSYIENNVFKLKPSQFMCDFEAGLRLSINKCYPNALLHGCWFHFSVCIRSRHIQSNMYKLITENQAAKKIYRKMQLLPLLPSQSVLNGFDIIKKEARATGLFREFNDIFRYFETYWINLVRFFRLKSDLMQALIFQLFPILCSMQKTHYQLQN